MANIGQEICIKSWGVTPGKGAGVKLYEYIAKSIKLSWAFGSSIWNYFSNIFLKHFCVKKETEAGLFSGLQQWDREKLVFELWNFV